MASSTKQSDRSFIGPRVRSTRQISVLLGHSTSFRRTLAQRCSPSLQGNVEARINPVIRSIFGNRWRGHGITLNNCGNEYRKLNIWGMKSSKSVLLKWP